MKKAFWQLHIAVFLAGFTGIMGRLITLNEGMLVWYRMLLSAFLLWLLPAFRKKLQPLSIAKKLEITGVGFIVALHWVTFYGAVKYANVSVALVCFSAIGFFTALLEPLIRRRKVIIAEVSLGLLVMSGIYIIFHFDPQYKTGIVLGLISAALAALFPILNSRLVQQMNPETLTTYELSGGVAMLTIGLPFYLHYFPVPSLLPGWQDAGWLLLLAAFCTVWAFQLSLNALKKISAFTANLSYNLEPVYGILLAFALFREDRFLGASFYIGLALIILAVALQTWRVYRTARRPVAK